MTIREDKKLLVDGAPFFPIGLYYAEEEIAEESGAGLAELRAMGFNTVFFSGGIAQKPALDRIAAAGLRAQFRPPGSLNSQFDELEKAVVALRTHPALLLWEHEDEPVLNKVKFEDSKRGYELMKRLDPDHPVLCIQWPDWRNPSKLGGEPDAPAVLRKWGTICDIYGYDKYPVPLRRWFYQGDEIPPGFPHSIAVMGPLTTWWQELAPTKPVLPVLQAWAWRPVKDGREGYPTREQARFMAYQVAIRGACGILYYGKIRVGQPHTPSGIPEELSSDPAKLAADFAKAKELNAWFWSYFREVVMEVSDMSPVFLAADAVMQPRVEVLGGGAAEKDIECRGKRIGDGEVLLLVNGSDNPAELRVTAPRFRDRTVHCWREKRTLTADTASAFSDHIGPFGVRIYATSARP